MSIEVKYKKLGRQKAYGIADEYITLDTRLKGKKHLEILIHEALHILFHELSEDEVVTKSILLTNLLWSESYRKTDLDNSQPLQDGNTQ